MRRGSPPKQFWVYYYTMKNLYEDEPIFSEIDNFAPSIVRKLSATEYDWQGHSMMYTPVNSFLTVFGNSCILSINLDLYNCIIRIFYLTRIILSNLIPCFKGMKVFNFFDISTLIMYTYRNVGWWTSFFTIIYSNKNSILVMQSPGKNLAWVPILSEEYYNWPWGGPIILWPGSKYHYDVWPHVKLLPGAKYYQTPAFVDFIIHNIIKVSIVSSFFPNSPQPLNLFMSTLS